MRKIKVAVLDSGISANLSSAIREAFGAAVIPNMIITQNIPFQLRAGEYKIYNDFHIYDESPISKPPMGRTVKHHNIIQQMNKRNY